MAPRFISRQLSCPTGFFAPIMGLLMNRHNAKMNGFALQQLDVKEGYEEPQDGLDDSERDAPEDLDDPE